MSITTKQIAELRRLEAAATPGPWEQQYGEVFGLHNSIVDTAKCADAELISIARNMIVPLCDEIDRLRAALKHFADMSKDVTLRKGGWSGEALNGLSDHCEDAAKALGVGDDT